MQADEHRLRHAGRVVDARPAEGFDEDLLDPLAVHRVEPVPRQVDEAGEEAVEGVPPDEEPHALALAQVQDRERDLAELGLRDLEQLVARVVLEDVDECLVVVASVRQSRAVEHGLHLPAQDRDLPRARAICGVGIEAEESPLAAHLTRSVEALDSDVVEVRRPVDRRP